MFILNPYDSGLHRYTRAILAKADLEGFVKPNTATIKAMDRMIRGLDSSGIWDKCDGLWFSAYNDTNLMNFTSINWINPSFNLTIIGDGVSLQSSGWKFDGSGGASVNVPSTMGACINTRWNITTDNIHLQNEDAHFSALVHNVSDTSTAGNSIISGGGTNGHNRWSVYNTNIQRIVSNANIDSSADLTGTGFKSINRTSSTDVVLTNKATTLSRTQSNVFNSMGILIGGNSTTLRSALGISSFSVGSNLVGKTEEFRILLNTYLTDIGLSAIA